MVVIVVVALFGATMIPYASASEHEAEQQNNSTVNVGVGQSLSVAISSTSSDVEQQVDEIARNRSLGEATTDGERAEVLSEDLNETLQDARDVRTRYRETIDEYKNGNITKSELITRIASISDDADRVERNLQNIEYATQFIPDDALNQSNVTQERVENARSQVGVVGSEVAQNVRRSALNPGSQVSVNASDRALEATSRGQNGSSYEGRDVEMEEHGQFNISADDALRAVEDRFGINASNYEVSVERDDDGYYEVEAENETGKYEATVDGRDGSLVSFEQEMGRRGPPEDVPREPPEDVPRGPPEDTPGQDNEDEEEAEDDERGPPEDVPRGPPEWAQDGEDELTVEVEGDVEPNATVTLVVTDGNAVENAAVNVNGEVAGQTDSEGRLEVQIPDAEEVEIDVEKDDAEGELEYEFEEDEDAEEAEDEEAEEDEAQDEEAEDNETENSTAEVGELTVEVTDRNNQSVTVRVQEDGENAEGVNVTVNGESAGQTDSEGIITVQIPEEGDIEIVAQKGDEEAEYEIERDEESRNPTDEE